MTARPHMVEAATATVTPITDTVFERAMQGALGAGRNWSLKLRHAQVLSASPDPRHRRLAEHIRDAHSLDQAGLLKPAILDLTPEMRARGTVTVISPPPYSPRRGTIRRELVGVAGLAVVVCAALAVLMMGAV